MKAGAPDIDRRGNPMPSNERPDPTSKPTPARLARIPRQRQVPSAEVIPFGPFLARRTAERNDRDRPSPA